MKSFTQSQGKAIHIITITGSDKPDHREVSVMAVSGRYAMVRRPRCMPYVTNVSELFEREDAKA